MSAPLSEVDPEVAAAAFGTDLDRYWQGGRPSERGWTRTDLDPLTTIVGCSGRSPDGATHAHLVKLEGHYYPLHPPRVTFVIPESYAEAPGDSPWFPQADPSGAEGRAAWFGLHPRYEYPDGAHRQLVCFSQSLDFYVSDHNPGQSEVWRQGVHTLAATLNRVNEILGPTYYRGPAPRLQEAA